jgi:Xaa-Pro dipeptidase
MLRAGSEHFSIQPIVAVGPRAGVPHSESVGKRVERRQCVFLEIGACRHRYTAPIMRTLVVGEPEPRLAALAKVAEVTIAAVMRASAPGVPAKDVALAGQRVIDEDSSGILFHRYFGYPVGFGVPPSWLENLAFLIQASNEEPMDVGMVFHVPLSLRHLGERGVGLSQTLEITTDGAVPLSSVPPRLIVKDA